MAKCKYLGMKITHESHIIPHEMKSAKLGSVCSSHFCTYYLSVFSLKKLKV